MAAEKKYVYPRSAEELMDRQRLRSIDLDDEARRNIADLVRELALWIAHSKAIPQVATAERNGVAKDAIAQIWAHENRAARDGFDDWFVNVKSPSFADAERAFALLPVFNRERMRKERDPNTGKVLLRFPKMNTERRRAYGVPDPFLNTPTRLNLLAQWTNLPPGVLLIAFRMTENKYGKDIPVFPWLKDRIEQALRARSIRPYGAATSARPEHTTNTVPNRPEAQQISLFHPEAHATTWPIVSEKQPEREQGARPRGDSYEERVQQMFADLAVLKAGVGEWKRFLDLFGGATRFGELYGVKASTFRDFWVRRDQRRPGPKTLARIERIITVASEAIAEHGLLDSDAIRETIEVKAKESPTITQLANLRRKPNAGDDKNDDFGGGMVLRRVPDGGIGR